MEPLTNTSGLTLFTPPKYTRVLARLTRNPLTLGRNRSMFNLARYSGWIGPIDRFILRCRLGQPRLFWQCERGITNISVSYCGALCTAPFIIVPVYFTTLYSTQWVHNVQMTIPSEPNTRVQSLVYANAQDRALLGCFMGCSGVGLRNSYKWEIIWWEVCGHLNNAAND